MTERTLCVWFPDWPLRRPDAPPDRPCIVVDPAGEVVAADPSAGRAGVQIGMRRREAEGVCPTAVTLIADRTAEAIAFEPVVRAVEEIVPRVEIVVPGLAFIPVAGAIRYYGGEGPIVAAVAEAVAACAPGARLGLADGPFAARVAAVAADDGPCIVEDTAAFLAGFDLSVLGVSEIVDPFRWLGITTLGDLGTLPRAVVASRFGPAGLRAHRIATGEDRAVSPRALPRDVMVEERFDPPIADLDRAAFAARALAARLTEALGPWGGIPHRVMVEAESAGGSVRTRIWRSTDPFSEADVAERMRWQLQAWVEGSGIPGGISRLLLAPGDRSDRGRQLRLDDDASSEIETHRAMARVEALMGPDAVLGSRPQGGRDPGEQVQWYRWDEQPGPPARDPAAPWPGRIPPPAPSLVVGEERLLDVEWDGGFPSRIRLGSRWEPVLGWAGPWRRTGRWWEGESPADRYQIVTSAGAFLCEVREGRCVMRGVYD